MRAILSNNFSFERVIQLCRRYIAIKKRMLIIGASISFGLVLIIYLGMVSLAPEAFKQNGVFNVMTIGITIFTYTGYALSSTMFYELNSAGSATMYFTLPTSSFEKLLSALFLSYFCYSLVGLVILYILSIVLGVTDNIFLSVKTLNSLLLYTFFQSVFLFGAAYFKSNNFLSTVVGIMAVAIIISLSVLFLDYIGLWRDGWSLSTLFDISESDKAAILIKNLVQTIVTTGFFIWMAFRRLKNRQIA